MTMRKCMHCPHSLIIGVFIKTAVFYVIITTVVGCLHIFFILIRMLSQ